MKGINEKLGKLVALAHSISTTTKTDVFVDYHGHVNSIDVYYFKDGWYDGAESTYIEFCEKVNFKNINHAIKELKKLERELKNGTN